MKKTRLLKVILLIVCICSYVIVYALNHNAIPGATVGYEIVVDEKYAYISTNDGVEIVDIVNKRSPVVVGTVEIDEMGFGFAVDENLMYVADSSSGLVIADVSDPSAPSIISDTGFAGGALHLAYQDDLVFLMDWNSIRIVDASDPQNPALLVTYTSPQAQDYRDVLVSGDLLYIADGSRGVEIVNTSIPDAPTLAATIITQAPIALHKHQDMLYLGCHGAGVKWYDVSNIHSPILMGSFQEPGGEAYGVWSNDSHLYVADLQRGIYSLDIRGIPSKIHHNYDTAPHDITGDDKHVYLGDQDYRLKIFDKQLNCLYKGHMVGYGVPVVLSLISVAILLPPYVQRWRDQRK